MNFDMYPKKRMLLVALVGLFFSNFSYASRPQCNNCTTSLAAGVDAEHEQDESYNNGNDIKTALKVQNDSNETVYIGQLDDTGTWEKFPVYRRVYAGDDVCLKYVPKQGIELKPHSSLILTDPMPSSFWLENNVGNYCRYSFTRNGRTIGVRYDQAGVNGIDGAYYLEEKNDIGVDFTTDKGILRVF